MKIVVNTRSLIPNKLDGIGWFTYQTLRRITQQNQNIEFVFLFDRPFSKEFIFGKNVTPIVLFPPARHPFLYLWFYQWSVKKQLDKIKPDLFLAPDGLLVLGAKCKQLAVVHDINFLHYPKDLKFFYSKYYNFLVPRFVKAATRIATVSEFSKQDIVKQYGIKPSKIDVVYNGINEGYMPLTEGEIDLVRKKYSEGKPYFLFVGSQSPRKNLVRLIKAFDIYKLKTKSNYKLVLVGSSFWGEGEIAQALKDSTFSSDILFTGRLVQTELEKIMAAAFALTFVSYFEGFGIPLVEAMQCGVPIISSNTSCMPEIAGNAALYVDPFNIDEMAKEMENLYSSPEIKQDLIRKGNSRKLNFSWNQTANKLWNSIEKTILE
ncbi:MAG: glycosyltransferase family 4 protein [Bacteroidia bacterium]|nr:glycosyltransferase family 4 protein [Bacteroidia bacterium]MCF8425461.1 glycosyltransferase family 4 protein [Bacteroidia bacterium]MCF8445877.1 glycosyltransferase family 4 protein [Bacteroidia bacterium]